MIKISQAGAIDVNGSGNWTVAADTPRGDVYLLAHNWEDERRAEAFSKRVMERGTIDPDRWVHWRTVYGSDAFQEEEAEAYMYASSLRAGVGRLEDVPENIRTLL